jgi:RNA polymerase sigma-70 factor, ECF subfamily
MLLMSHLEDKLLAGAKAGDRESLGKLLKNHGPRVRASLNINSKWKSVLETEDVLQVTYLEAFQCIDRFEGDSSAFLAWLKRIAIHNLRDAIEYLERQKRPQPDKRLVPKTGDSIVWLHEFATRSGTTPSGKCSREECRSILKTAIQELPTIYADVLRAIYFEDKSVAEVSETMGRTKGAIHLLRSRAMDRLRQQLGSGIF